MIIKNVALSLTAAITLTLTTLTNANTAATFVLDMPNAAELPKHFRTTSDPQPIIKNMNWHGFADLHIAGGAQFSALTLEKILAHLDTKKVTIIDLRQESHGFVSGDAVSWYGAHNAENEGKNTAQIERSQAKHLMALRQLKEVTVYKILKKSDNQIIAETEPVSLQVQDVLSEAQLVKKFDVNYQRVYVQDFHAPETREVDRFIQIYKQIPKESWIYFHCRAGVGRTSTFMTMVDMMHNAKHVTFDDILARQTAIGGKDLTDLPSPDEYKYPFAVERLEFLKKFYEYARQNHDNFATLWSDWIKQ